ncbi:MAG: MoaD/ThiS family protein [Phycisphaera sp.]|nr:MoaD/ThiS family protein [Phycisphaera sp.]
MPTIGFTANVAKYVDVSPPRLTGDTVRAALEDLFAINPKLRSYVLDDQGAVRTHVVVFVNGEAIADRATLSEAVKDDDEIFIAQALSGG